MNLLIFVINSLSLVFLLQSVTCLEDVSLNNLSFKTVVSLLNVLSKYRNDVAYVEIQPNRDNQKPNHRNTIKKNDNWNKFIEVMDDYWMDDLVTDKKFRRPGKHILIKRLLPHGMTPSKLEYDSKYGTFYRPIVRVHKRRPVPKIGTILNIDGSTVGVDEHGIDMYDYYDNDENVLKFAVNKDLNENLKHFKVKDVLSKHFDVDEELLQPFNTNFTRNFEPLQDLSTHLGVLEEIQRLLKRVRSNSTRAETYRDIIKVLDKISSLRSHQKSGEDNDPMAPGKLVNQADDDMDEGPARPKKWIPHYAPWNFWTYKKTIYQDVCPEGQVKIANLCIWLPPH